MYDILLTYKDIFDGQEDVPERCETHPCRLDDKITKDLVVLLQIKDINLEIDNFSEIRENKIDNLRKQLNYSYDESGEKNDYESRQKRSKNVLKNVKWKEEISLVQEKAKVDILRYIKQKGLIIDTLKYGTGDDQMTALSVTIGEVEVGDDDPFIYILPEFVLNKAGHIQEGEEDMSLEIDVDEIKEIIVDETKYKFLF